MCYIYQTRYEHLILFILSLNCVSKYITNMFSFSSGNFNFKLPAADKTALTALIP